MDAHSYVIDNINIAIELHEGLEKVYPSLHNQNTMADLMDCRDAVRKLAVEKRSEKLIQQVSK